MHQCTVHHADLDGDQRGQLKFSISPNGIRMALEDCRLATAAHAMLDLTPVGAQNNLAADRASISVLAAHLLFAQEIES